MKLVKSKRKKKEHEKKGTGIRWAEKQEELLKYKP